MTASCCSKQDCRCGRAALYKLATYRDVLFQVANGGFGDFCDSIEQILVYFNVSSKVHDRSVGADSSCVVVLATFNDEDVRR
jgi:hypothetical protein